MSKPLLPISGMFTLYRKSLDRLSHYHGKNLVVWEKIQHQNY